MKKIIGINKITARNSSMRNLKKSFNHADGKITLFENFNIKIKEGELVALVGPSGSGKSSLLHLLALLDEPTKGEIILNKQETQHLSNYQKDELRRSSVSIIFQDNNLLTDFTAIENVMMPLLIKNIHKEEAKYKAQKILKTVKDEFNVPIISDIHEPSQAETAAEVLDVIQIPAFLSRQTDLIKAACETEKVINVKKAQFLSPAQMKNIIEKCNHFGNENILLCERGSIFGYDNLIVDFLGIDEIKKIAPTILDITHSLQLPGGKGKSADGRSSQAKVLGTAAAAIGLAGFFIEVHPSPENALCDGASATRLSEFESLLLELKKFDELSKS